MSNTGTIKREYPLLELLSSERTYARDLVLLRDYQIPLASGRLSTMSSIWSAVENTTCQYLGLEPATASNWNAGPTTPGPESSAVTALHRIENFSAVSAVSLNSIFTLRPMKTKDVHVVFSNIEELAAFSDDFLSQLESALGTLIEGNVGEDHVGRLFLESMSQMERLYTTYILNQPRALEHYRHLSQTFQFDVYFPRCQILAHKSSNAWDLPSLLIKPVQRLLHYPQLLAAILSETPSSHSDKASLVEAHTRMEELARGLNTRWRHHKLVREVLASEGLALGMPHVRGDAARTTPKKGNIKLGLPTSVSLGRIRVMSVSLRSGASRALKDGVEPELDNEARAVKAMGERLKAYTEFMAQFMGETMHWADATCNLVGALDEWTKGFERVIWQDRRDAPRSEAFDAFRGLVSDQWLPVCHKLGSEIKEDVLPSIVSLTSTTEAPVRLLEVMQTLEQLHYDRPSIPAGTKSRRPSQPVEASESYLALRAQLLVDLPKYLALLDRGMVTCIRKFAHIQWRFYTRVRDLGAELRDYVNSDQEANEGDATTLRVLCDRYQEVEAHVMDLTIVRMPTPEQEDVNPSQ